MIMSAGKNAFQEGFMDDWIDVNNRLPEIAEDYLIYASGYQEFYVASWKILEFNKKNWHWVIKCECIYAEGENFTQDMVTHWRPLPKPPEDLCETCGKISLHCCCEYKFFNRNKVWINQWSKKIHEDRIKENERFINENFPKSVKSFDASKSDCEGLQNFNGESDAKSEEDIVKEVLEKIFRDHKILVEQFIGEIKSSNNGENHGK